MPTVRPFIVFPGGKAKSTPLLLDLIPHDQPILSPFIGGGSVEINLAVRGQRVYAHDIWEAVTDFWQVLLDDPDLLADSIDDIPVKYFKYRDYLRRFDQPKITTKLERAVMFYGLCQSAYAGKLNNRRPVPSRRIPTRIRDRIRNTDLSLLSVDRMDCFDSLEKYPDLFVYADPPYLYKDGTSRDSYYGRDGEYHKDFNHEQFAEIMTARKNWVMHYNDCPEIRLLYRKQKIYNLNEAGLSWGRAMGLMGTTKKQDPLTEELLIFG